MFSKFFPLFLLSEVRFFQPVHGRAKDNQNMYIGGCQKQYVLDGPVEQVLTINIVKHNPQQCSLLVAFPKH